MYELSLLFYILVFALILKSGQYLLIFLFLSYTLQFWALFFEGEHVAFWLRGNYTFSKDDPIAIYMLKVFFLTNLGFLCSLLFINKKVYVNERFLPKDKIPNFINLLFIMLVGGVITLNYLIDRFDLMFNGVDLLITALLSITILSAMSKKSRLQLVILAGLFLLYIYTQITSADRNFIGILITGCIFYVSFFRLTKFRFIAIGIGFILILFIGIYIAIERAGAELNLKVLFTYAYYNSWMAVIRPVIDLIQFENLDVDYLYGKSYLDLALSFAPSALYNSIGLVKPFVADNPAQWYAVEGGGGMHAVGVAIKNFGLLGVFLQGFLFSVFSIKLTEFTIRNNSVLSYAFFVCISITYMKSIWYSMLDFVNVITFFILFLCLIKTLFILLPKTNKNIKEGFI
jgi:hypothetical protein